MPFNGSGTFQPVAPPDYPAVAGTIIRADQFNAVVNDLMYNGLTNCITRDGQSPPSADLPMANFRHTGVGAATALTQYARMDQLTTGGAALWAGAAGGTANALTLTLPVAPTALVVGLTVAFVATADNTGASTINLNGLGATTVETYYGNALVADHFRNGRMYAVRYDGTTWVDITPFNRATNQVVTGTWGFQSAVTFSAPASFTDDVTFSGDILGAIHLINSLEVDGSARFDGNVGFYGTSPIAQQGPITTTGVTSVSTVPSGASDIPNAASIPDAGVAPADAAALAADINSNILPAIRTALTNHRTAIQTNSVLFDNTRGVVAFLARILQNLGLVS